MAYKLNLLHRSYLQNIL